MDKKIKLTEEELFDFMLLVWEKGSDHGRAWCEYYHTDGISLKEVENIPGPHQVINDIIKIIK